MKIGIVCFPSFGGSGVVATELGTYLAFQGHKIHFITYERPARLTFFHENIFFHEVAPFKYPLFRYTPYETSLASKMVEVVEYQKLDILHVHYAIPHASVAFLAKQILASKGIHIPIITTLHGTDITLVGKDNSLKPVIEFSINNSDGVTCVSQYLKDTTYEYFNITREIEVIYNFIDFSKFSKTNKEHFKKIIAPSGEKIITHVSNLREVKRAEDTIYIFQKINQKIPSTLLIIGDGPQRANLEMLCKRMGLCDQIRFLGKQEAVEDLLSISDLFILPSASESFGLAALEAMAIEVPVISSNIGGIPEVNVQGETGYLCDVGDIDKMAERALYILSDEKIHSQFKRKALHRAKEFDINKIVPQYFDLYEKVREKKPIDLLTLT